MAKIFGGGASRLEMYALFVAAVVLIGGGIGGAIVVTSGDETSAPVTVVETSSTTTRTAVPVEVTLPSTTIAPINQLGPPTSRYVDPPPVTVTPDQPIQDFSAYGVMPDVLGYFGVPTVNNSGMEIQAPFQKLAEAGCFPAWNNSGALVNVSWCLEVEMPSNYVVRVIEQNPSAGTLVHKSFGRIVLRIAESGRGYDLSRTDGHPPFC